MNKSYLQCLIDGMGAQMRHERSKSQMTLGKMIAALEGMPDEATVANLRDEHSYRGYYSDLAFELCEGTRPAVDLLNDCRQALTETFRGYKGGDFEMDESTPVWVAHYGACGQRLMAVHPGGKIEMEEEAEYAKVYARFGEPHDLASQLEEANNEIASLKEELETWKRRAQEFELAVGGRR